MPHQEGHEIEFPVDDETYNLMQTLVSKLEALDAYRTYLEDMEGENQTLFAELAQQDQQNAQRLLEALRQRLSQG